MSLQQQPLVRNVSSPWKGRACFVAALIFAGSTGGLLYPYQLHLILGVPCLLYWARKEIGYRFFYFGGLAIFLCGMLAQVRAWFQHSGDIVHFILVNSISLILWTLCLRLILGLLSEIQKLQETVEQHIRNVNSLELIEKRSVLERQREEQARQDENEWDVLVRNARDGGANSVLACDVMEKTAALLEKNNEQVKEMVQAANSVERDTDQLTEISKEIRALSIQAKFLSLNIAVQAARSGESGKTFRLVAEQMKEMTDSTEMLTRTIDQRLSDIKGQTTKSTHLCGKVGKVFKSVKEELEQFRKLMLRIQELSTSQSRSLRTIKEGIDNNSKHSSKAKKIIRQSEEPLD